MATKLPLDIPVGKSVEWLTQRRLVPSAYQKSLRLVHAKVSEALSAPRDEVEGLRELLPAGTTQEQLTYFDCLKVVDVLKAAGLAEKNFLGQYSNPHTARWADIIRRYESGTVFLADTASYLVQQTTYELPALKAEVRRAEKELTELQRRQGEYQRLALCAEERFKEGCARRNIEACEAEHIEAALTRCKQQLPQLYLRVAFLCQGEPLTRAVLLYQDFVRFSLTRAKHTAAPPAAAAAAATASKPKSKPKGSTKAEGKGEDKGEGKGEGVAVACAEEAAAESLPMLRRVQRLDLVGITVQAEAAHPPDTQAPAAGGIDWGEGQDAAGGGGVEVNWGDDDAGGGGGGVEVNWGDDDAGGGGGGAVEVNWGDDDAGGGGGGGGGGAGVVEVNWGDDNAAAGGVVEVTWGDEDAAGGVGAAAVDWGDDDAADGGGGGVNWGDDDAGGVGGGVNWGDDDAGGGGGGCVSAGEGGGSVGGGEWVDLIEVEGVGSGVCAEEESLLELFERAGSRDELLDDLYEVLAFVQQRKAEAMGAGEGLPVGLQLDAGELSSLGLAAEEAVEALDSEHARHLLQLQSARYVERQAAGLRQSLAHAHKMRALAEAMHTRQAELLLTVKAAYPKYERTAAKLRTVKADFEAALSHRHFDGRKVNLMGIDI